jgi:hypothetical protein
MANEDNFIVAICRRGEKLLLDDFLEIPDHALNGAGQTHLFYPKYNEINMLGPGWLRGKILLSDLNATCCEIVLP